jgi:diaminopimelate epimerase
MGSRRFRVFKQALRQAGEAGLSSSRICRYDASMTLPFTKMSGAGNDFILADNREGSIRLSPDQVRHLCDRHFGIGADGLMLLQADPTGAADFAWEFHNADGSAAEMCGNGARCFARYLRRVTGWDKPRVRFTTLAGVITAEFVGDQVAIHLTPPRQWQPPASLPTHQGPLEVHAINTGVPHAVVFVPDADHVPVDRTGRELRFHDHFQPRGTNVNFVQILKPGHIRVRTYERGVEGETLACGTGVTASALIAARAHGFGSPVRVQVQGGDELEVRFQSSGDGFKEVVLVGPADFVFEGQIPLADTR